MSDRRSPEHLLATWFELEAPPGAPDDLRTDIDRATARIRPRPAWVSRLKGNHMDVIVGGAGRRQPRLLPVLLVVGLILALGAAAVYVGSQPRREPAVILPSPTAGASAGTSAATPRPTPSATPAPSIVADTTIELPYNVFEVFVGSDALWVSVAGEGTNDSVRSIYRVDPATNQATLVISDIPAGPSSPISHAEAGGSLWLVDNGGDQVFRYDATSGDLVETTPVADFPLEPHVGFGSVWVLEYQVGQLSRIDPSSGDIVATIEIPRFAREGPRDVAAGAGLLWAITPRQDVMVAIDPATNEIVEEVELQPDLHCGVAVAAGRIWVTGCESNDAVQVFDEATQAAVGTVDAFPGMGLPVHVDGTTAWLPLGVDGTTHLFGVDATNPSAGGDRPDLGLGVTAGNLTNGFGSLWFSFEQNVYRLSLDALPSS
jgi:streptogramin lyase